MVVVDHFKLYGSLECLLSQSYPAEVEWQVLVHEPEV